MRPLFELMHCGHKWLIYEDGHVEGFPEGTIVINRAAPVMDAFRARTRLVENNSQHQTACNAI